MVAQTYVSFMLATACAHEGEGTLPTDTCYQGNGSCNFLNMLYYSVVFLGGILEEFR